MSTEFLKNISLLIYFVRINSYLPRQDKTASPQIFSGTIRPTMSECDFVSKLKSFTFDVANSW